MSDSTILCNRRPLPAAASPEIKKVLTIAGSDSSGGAGIQADIKTITAHKMYAMSAITSLTAQNTLGVKSILDAAPEFVADELDCIFQDIRPDAVKIGMVSKASIIEVISAKLREYQAENIVVDPVMVATSGSRLLDPAAMAALEAHLLPIASIITPNIPEAEVLTGRTIRTNADMLLAGQELAGKLFGAVLIKGGHLSCSADDLLCQKGSLQWFKSERIANENTHGTGCTLSSAIAAYLALGNSMLQAVQNGRVYVRAALAAGAQVRTGHGHGPVNHGFAPQAMHLISGA